jgi:hypothetical protein
MSGKKKLERAVRNNRVVALPSKKIEREAIDANGQAIVDKNGDVVTETIQLYKIKKMR